MWIDSGGDQQFPRDSQTCVQQLPLGPKIVAVVDRLSLLTRGLCSGDGYLSKFFSKWDHIMMVVVDSWSLFGGGH